jgi:hypothetical protein
MPLTVGSSMDRWIELAWMSWIEREGGRAVTVEGRRAVVATLTSAMDGQGLD